MAAVARFFGKFFGRTISDAAGYGIGGALQRPLEPPLQEITNQAWRFTSAAGFGIPLDAAATADIVAEDVEQLPWGIDQAAQGGTTEHAFRSLVGATLNAPGLGPLFEMWRRKLIGDADFVHGLRKSKLETLWDGPLEGLHDTLLSSQELAMLQQQGFIQPDRANAEGGLQGVTGERQQLRFEASGLPPGHGEGLEMLRRGIIDDAEFAQIVREGHTKTKYTGVLTQLRGRVLTAVDYAGLRLRGWITPAESYAGGALTGYSPDQMDKLFLNRGRPATTHQVFIGLRRGGAYDGPLTGIDPAFITAVKQSDIRPEWTNLLWHQRFTYPSAFVLRAMTQNGDLTPAETEQILLFVGWEPVLAATVSGRWGNATTEGSKQETRAELADEFEGGYINEAEFRAALGQLGYVGHVQDLEVHLSDARRVKKWREHAIAAIQKAYVKHDIDLAVALSMLGDAGVTGDAANRLFPYWDLERNSNVKHLTAAQVRAAYRKNVLTVEQATAALDELGYTTADIATYLAT